MLKTFATSLRPLVMSRLVAASPLASNSHFVYKKNQVRTQIFFFF